MPADEPVRLRLHRRLTELLDSQLADAMMESMPPMRWDQLATKEDVARLEARSERLEKALADHGERIEGRIDAQSHCHTDDFTRLEASIEAQSHRLEMSIETQGQRNAGELALLEGRLSVRYVETTRMIVFAMMTLFVGVVAVMVTTLN